MPLVIGYVLDSSTTYAEGYIKVNYILCTFNLIALIIMFVWTWIDPTKINPGAKGSTN